jgi:hypothetical protein
MTSGLVNQLLGDFQGVFPELSHRHFGTVQVSIQSAGIDDASQESAKQQTIESRQSTQDTLTELTYNRFHGVAPNRKWRVEIPTTKIGTTPFENQPSADCLGTRGRLS